MDLGRAMALGFAKGGADVVINEIDMPAAEEVAGEVKTLGRRSLAIKAAVTNHTLIVDGGWSVYRYLQSWLDETRE